MKTLSSHLTCLLTLISIFSISLNNSQAELRVGAAVVDITPLKLPVIVNGGMLSRTVDEVNTPLNARAIVIDDGKERLAIVVVDSCMVPKPLLDEAKALASQRTKIRPQRMLISSTHTHSAPSVMGALGTPADPAYVPYLREKIAESIATAEANLRPAKAGWSTTQAGEYTALRRWIRRPDRVVADPFGNMTVRATMHAGSNWDDVVGESGPEDPDLSMLAFSSLEGRPIAVLANFSMHYFSDRALSADYFGLFCEGFKNRVEPTKKQATSHPPFVGILSHGCSGDIWRRDYKIPAAKRNDKISIGDYTDGLLEIALQAYRGIEYKADLDIAMAETRMELNYRVPNQQLLKWAQGVVEEMGERLPKSQPEVYAREQLILYERQSTEIVVQALRIGEFGICTTPNETYALTGLKLKLQSPLEKTMVIELANGGDGYIPPPEQHLLGGYNTWAARSAGLEVQAEPKIVEAGLQLLEQVAGSSRRVHRQSVGATAIATLAAKPIAYWRLDEFAGPEAIDSSGNFRDAVLEPAAAYFLAGPDRHICEDETNRAIHFAGARLRARLPKLDANYSISTWIWNGMPTAARQVTGWISSRGRDHLVDPQGDHLGLGGGDSAGKLIFVQGKNDAAIAVGKSQVERWKWHHVALVREGKRVQVYLDGKLEIDVESGLPTTSSQQLLFAGRGDKKDGWEGRLDEIAVFDRVLTGAEIVQLADGETTNIKGSR
ncbi:MAG: hypothetical protein ACI9G1_001721 [Pirellulaceae bacterium]|jgi:hypothetical protein